MTSEHAVGGGKSRTLLHDLADEYWQTLARTADLVRKLTALADRYEAAAEGGDERASERRASVALMRSAAESGRQLITSLAPPPPVLASVHEASSAERADGARARDVRASGRDAAADGRDVRAAGRDRASRGVASDGDDCFPGRFLAACDRDDAVGDRAAALADRRAAAADRAAAASGPLVDLDQHARSYARVTRLEEQEIIRQAQGVLMARAGISAAEAFEALLLAAENPSAPGAVVKQALEPAEPDSR